MIIKLTEVVLDPRQREDYGDLSDLATSMADPKYGQLQEIVLDRNNHLLAGGRRFAAACLLATDGRAIAGLEPGTIEAKYKDVLDPLHAQLIELEENVRRLDLPWQEQAKAIKTIHKIKMATEADWTGDKTAALLSCSRRKVYDAIEPGTTVIITEQPVVRSRGKAAILEG